MSYTLGVNPTSPRGHATLQGSSRLNPRHPRPRSDITLSQSDLAGITRQRATSRSGYDNPTNLSTLDKVKVLLDLPYSTNEVQRPQSAAGTYYVLTSAG